MICSPYLPTKRLKKAIVGSKYKQTAFELNKLGIKTINLSSNACLDEEISSHADLSAFNLGNKKIILSDDLEGELSESLKEFEIIKAKNIHSPYPNDIKLNCILTDDKLIGNLKFIDKNIISEFNNKGIKFINTNQGYAKCTVCAVTNSSFITEDDGMERLLNNYQSNVLKIKKGYVNLSENHYGFIGGAACRISSNEIFFNGNIEEHPDYLRIKDFLNNLGFKAIYSKDYKLTDFGGIVPIC